MQSDHVIGHKVIRKSVSQVENRSTKKSMMVLRALVCNEKILQTLKAFTRPLRTSGRSFAAPLDSPTKSKMALFSPADDSLLFLHRSRQLGLNCPVFFS